jgi:hypothetical protein
MFPIKCCKLCFPLRPAVFEIIKRGRCVRTVTLCVQLPTCPRLSQPSPAAGVIVVIIEAWEIRTSHRCMRSECQRTYPYSLLLASSQIYERRRALFTPDGSNTSLIIRPWIQRTRTLSFQHPTAFRNSRLVFGTYKVRIPLGTPTILRFFVGFLSHSRHVPVLY